MTPPIDGILARYDLAEVYLDRIRTLWNSWDEDMRELVWRRISALSRPNQVLAWGVCLSSPNEAGQRLSEYGW